MILQHRLTLTGIPEAGRYLESFLRPVKLPEACGVFLPKREPVVSHCNPAWGVIWVRVRMGRAHMGPTHTDPDPYDPPSGVTMAHHGLTLRQKDPARLRKLHGP